MVIDKDRCLNFLDAAKGLTAWQAAKVLNLLTPGLNWRGMNKTEMSEAYSIGNCCGFVVPEAAIAELFKAPRKVTAKTWCMRCRTRHLMTTPHDRELGGLVRPWSP